MLDESGIALLIKEHSYSKKRRVYTREDLDARTVHLFNECEYSVCTLLNSTPSPVQPHQSNVVGPPTEDINVTDVGFQYEGFVHFKKTHYIETYRELMKDHDKTPTLEPHQPDRTEWNPDQRDLYEYMETLITGFFHGTEIILTEKNTTEYRMRKYRLMAESYASDLTSILEDIYYNMPKDMEWLTETMMDYFTDYQLRSYIELLTLILPNSFHLMNLLKFDTTSDCFDSVYRRKVFGTKINNLFFTFTDLWVPNMESQKSVSDGNKLTNEPTTEENVQMNVPEQEVALLIIPPLPCFVLEDGEEASTISSDSHPNYTQSERINIFEKYFKNAKILDYKIKPLDEKDFNDDMIQWWINDLACVIQRRIAQFRRMEPTTQLYIVGWLTGATLAYKIFLALLDQINGVVLINMPTNTGVLGVNKTLDTRLLYKSNRAIIFVASSESQLSNLNELREIRSSMTHPSSLIYVHYCDDLMLMKHQTKKRLILTQDIVDVTVVEGIRARIVYEIDSVTAIATSKLQAANKKSHSSANKNQCGGGGQRRSQTDTNNYYQTSSISSVAKNSRILNTINNLKSSSLNYNNPAMSFILANSARKLVNIASTSNMNSAELLQHLPVNSTLNRNIEHHLPPPPPPHPSSTTTTTSSTTTLAIDEKPPPSS